MLVYEGCARFCKLCVKLAIVLDLRRMNCAKRSLQFVKHKIKNANANSQFKAETRSIIKTDLEHHRTLLLAVQRDSEIILVNLWIIDFCV